MRKIRFRVWNKTNEKYEDFNLYAIDEGGDLYRLEGIGECVDLSLADEDDDYIIEQSTGLYDKNGKEIYEGDLFMDDGEYYVIKQPSGYAVLYLCHIDDNYGDDLDHYFFGEMEVIGNVNENKELLK